VTSDGWGSSAASSGDSPLHPDKTRSWLTGNSLRFTLRVKVCGFGAAGCAGGARRRPAARPAARDQIAGAEEGGAFRSPNSSRVRSSSSERRSRARRARCPCADRGAWAACLLGLGVFLDRLRRRGGLDGGRVRVLIERCGHGGLSGWRRAARGRRKTICGAVGVWPRQRLLGWERLPSVYPPAKERPKRAASPITPRISWRSSSSKKWCRFLGRR